jgi:hypothetical protein
VTHEYHRLPVFAPRFDQYGNIGFAIGIIARSPVDAIVKSLLHIDDYQGKRQRVCFTHASNPGDHCHTVCAV